MPTFETTLPADINRPLLDAYDEANLNFAKRQLYFESLPVGHDSMLFETVTVYSAAAKSKGSKLTKKDLVMPDRKPSVILHHSFPIIWDVLQDDQKDNSICHRAYWLGEAWPNDTIDSKLVSSFLIKSLAERVKRFKKNISMNLLTPYDKHVQAYSPQTYEVGIDYRTWFYEAKGQSKYDWKIVNAFAEGKKVKPIEDEFIFCYKTDVLTEEEIALIYEELEKNPEPRLEVRPRVLDQGSHQTIDKLADVVGKLAELQLKTESTKGK